MKDESAPALLKQPKPKLLKGQEALVTGAKFLLSYRSDCITGANVFVDGCMTLYPWFTTGG